MQVTNISNIDRHYTVGKNKEGAANIEVVQAGESRTVPGLTEDNVYLKADVHARLVEIGKPASVAKGA